MKCRRIVDGNIVWFKSDGNNVGLDNYSDKQQAIVDSLTQKLSVIAGELWYNKRFGLPLLDKVKSKAIIDAKVLETVNGTKDVNAVEDFESRLSGNSYACSMTIVTVYGKVSLTI